MIANQENYLRTFLAYNNIKEKDIIKIIKILNGSLKENDEKSKILILLYNNIDKYYTRLKLFLKPQLKEIIQSIKDTIILKVKEEVISDYRENETRSIQRIAFELTKNNYNKNSSSVDSAQSTR